MRLLKLPNKDPKKEKKASSLKSVDSFTVLSSRQANSAASAIAVEVLIKNIFRTKKNL
jgi:hypothetical protein